MSADNYLLIRKHAGGYLVSQEWLSDDIQSDPDETYARAMGPKSLQTDGFFDSERQAKEFVDMIYSNANGPDPDYIIEYGANYAYKGA